MVTKSKLKLALSAEKGVDWQKLQQKKKHKEAERRKRNAAGNRAAKVAGEEDDASVGGPEQEQQDKGGAGQPLEEVDWEDEVSGGEAMSEEDAEDENGLIGVDDSDSSGSDIEMEEAKPRAPKTHITQSGRQRAPAQEEDQEESEEDEEEEEEDDIPMSDLDELPDEDKEDLIRHTRLTINNTAAMTASRNRIAIPADASVPFSTHMSITSANAAADAIPDIQDDLGREQAFHAQALEAVKQARQMLKQEGVPFSRPNDYFAEMVKDDGHMEKVKTKLVEEATAKKASAEARKLRELKKFGKQVQVNKMQERHKAKRETLDKIKQLKRKRQESSNDLGTNEADLFDVAVDNELKSHANKQASARPRGGRDGGPGSQVKRQKKDDKYGFGGRKRFSKSGDAVSTGDMSDFSVRRMKDGPSRGGGSARRGGRGGRGGAGGGRGGKPTPRPGKSRRKVMAAKR